MIPKTIAIAGASGFVGEALASLLHGKFRLVGLSRSAQKPTPGGIDEWRACDLFSLLDAEQALAGVDVAFYLVHSMMPSARLTQGSFQDRDLIAADNFSRAAARAGVKQIIYLGGLVDKSASLSRHLLSRLEVEETLASHGVPVTALRAGLIIGPKGSSFVLLKRLVERLPAMVLPSWTETLTQPISLDDIVALLTYCIGRETTFAQHFDVGGPDIVTYRQMIERLAARLGHRPLLVKVPYVAPGFSRLWVSLVTKAPRSLVAPLVESLCHPMIADDRRLQAEAHLPGLSLDAALDAALATPEKVRANPAAFTPRNVGKTESDVRSVQRLDLPTGRTADWAAREYMRWLPRIFPPLLRVHVNETHVSFDLWPFRFPLLSLDYSTERSTPDRALFYIRGGLLARIQGRGRLEFRSTLNNRYVLAAVHEFRPSLPWWLYAFTQAKLHAIVMWAFGRHLKQLAKLAHSP